MKILCTTKLSFGSRRLTRVQNHIRTVRVLIWGKLRIMQVAPTHLRLRPRQNVMGRDYSTQLCYATLRHATPYHTTSCCNKPPGELFGNGPPRELPNSTQDYTGFKSSEALSTNRIISRLAVKTSITHILDTRYLYISLYPLSYLLIVS